jgi:hypothetical protein
MKAACFCTSGLSLLALLLSILAGQAADSADKSRVVSRVPGWPVVFELDPDGSFTLPTKTGSREIRLLSFEEVTQPDYWITGNPSHTTIAAARVTVAVGGQKAVLLQRAYQMPFTVNGVRLYVETTRPWGTAKQTDPIKDIQKAVRFSAVPAGEPWGPRTIRFPIADYRWRSATYQNTASSLVAFNGCYYHRGEDFGNIPARRRALALFDGKVAITPLPNGDTDSNSLVIESSDGLGVEYAHMDTDLVNPAMTLGTAVKAGDELGKTGMTWNGRKSQVSDPHIHVLMTERGTIVSLYPTLIEAYFRDYPDALLPVAGGYAFGVAGQPIVLDATRSLARPGKRIASWQWTLPNGSTTNQAVTSVTFPRPGYYSVPLEVKTAEGDRDRDFLQVRIYDPALQTPRDIAHGSIFAWPTRGVRPGTQVTLWNRLVNTSNASVDWGDGATGPIGREAVHAYRAAGLYTVTVSGVGPRREPATARLRIVVEAPA